jgi:hypothetical protein
MKSDRKLRGREGKRMKTNEKKKKSRKEIEEEKIK